LHMISKKGLVMSKNAKLIAMREGGRILATILAEVRAKTVPGVTTAELDELARRLCLKYRVKPSFLNYDGYPAAICISVNDEVVHGIPGDRIIKNGDLVSLDFGVGLGGYHTDSAISFGVGNISAEDHRLLTVTEKSLLAAIEKVKPGVRIGLIGETVQREVEAGGFGVVRALVGHAIGHQVHEQPYIPNFGKASEGEVIEEGMTLAIEPMVTEGSYEVATADDGWTYMTKDGSRAAHFEHTIYVHADHAEILTTKV
jgi:methionyl aminopeptidase